jgi:hypothetical protein
MRHFLIIPLLLLFFTKGHTCECPEYKLRKLDSLSYAYSDLVLIGTIVKIGSEYKIKILELLKGETKDEILIGLTGGEDEIFSTCSFYPNKTGEYLLYLNRKAIKGRTIYYASECLGSRLLNSDYYPISLNENESKEVLIQETNEWISELRKQKK